MNSIDVDRVEKVGGGQEIDLAPRTAVDGFVALGSPAGYQLSPFTSEHHITMEVLSGTEISREVLLLIEGAKEFLGEFPIP